MLTVVEGLHHVTSLSADAQRNNNFFTQVLGLRRVKKTVNFDAPEVYHLYYADRLGSPGTVMTYFPFPGMQTGRRGTGEIGVSAFSIPSGSADFWTARLGASVQIDDLYFGTRRIVFDGPDGDQLALIETASDAREPWQVDDIPPEAALRGFHSVSMRLVDIGAMAELLSFLGYKEAEREGNTTRFQTKGNGANGIDLEHLPDLAGAQQGAGSVHHVAFAVKDRAAQLETRRALLDAGYGVTPVIDRDYFWAIYFRAPGGVLFEIATNEPGFGRDEPIAELGQSLKLPTQHADLRDHLEEVLPPIA